MAFQSAGPVSPMEGPHVPLGGLNNQFTAQSHPANGPTPMDSVVASARQDDDSASTAHAGATDSPTTAATPTAASPAASSADGSSPSATIPKLGATYSHLNKREWLPSTLRWYSLAVPIFVSLALGIAIAVLCWYSDRYHGLGNDDGSSGILFGWRFTPTLIAVLYTQLTVILFEDVKRTEPFARLAKPPAGGATAAGTILHTPKAWWGIFIDAIFRRKKNGKTTWSLLGVALVNVIALLAISPLSSALLTSEEIFIPQAVPFTRWTLDTQLPLNMTRNTYFRITSALYGNVSTSPWTSDASFTLPFWPKSEEKQFQPVLQSAFRSWIADTTILRPTFECQDMSVSSSISRKPYSGALDIPNRVPRNGTQPMVSFVLQSKDGCRYELDNHPNVELAGNGGVSWTKASEYIVQGGTMYLEALTGRGSSSSGVAVIANLTSTHPWARLNTTQQCDGREIIITSTPWVKQRRFTSYTNEGVRWLENATYEQSPDFRMRALLCDSQYYMAKRSLSATMSASANAQLDFAPGTLEETKPIPRDLFNGSEFQSHITQDIWNPYVKSTRQRPWNESEQDPMTIGLGPILAASTKFDILSLLNDPQLIERTARIRGRVFSEVLRDAVTLPSTVQEELFEGQATTVEDRVVVLTEVGATLTALFLASCFMLLAVLWLSRLSRRPLNLQSDPASTVGMTVLLDQRQNRTLTLRSMHKASKSDLYSALRREKFSTFDSTLLSEGSQTPQTPNKKRNTKSDWRPWAIHLRTLVALASFLLVILTAVLVLNSFSARSHLSQLAFVYEADVSKFGLSFKTFAPISIAPTVISILVGLWWDQLDQTFRILQPYLAMSRSPTPINSGAGLTYRSKTWIGAAVKAAKHRHWLLFAICLGSTLCQVLTVSMSALFERQPKVVTDQVSLNRTLEMRQLPHVYRETIGQPRQGTPFLSAALDSIYDDTTTNFILNAAMQLALNGSRPTWTADEWSFIPLDMSQVPETESVRAQRAGSDSGIRTSSTNVTVYTSAIRARLECHNVEEVRTNVSSWLDEVPEVANLTQLDDLNMTGRIFMLPSLRELKPNVMFEGTPYETQDSENIFNCCQNGTAQDPKSSVIGYWSVLNIPGWQALNLRSTSPRAGIKWPMAFIPKWIRGKDGRVSLSSSGHPEHVVYTEQPVMQAAQCTPIIETADALVAIDKDTKVVNSYRILSAAGSADAAWSEVFVLHEQINRTDIIYDRDITTSYGILFLSALLGAADRSSIPGAGDVLNANTFQDAGHGVNMDLLSYSMYTQAGQNPDAFLNYTALVNAANHTFQTYFQHFVNNKLSVGDGGWAYQKIGDVSLEGLRKPVDENGTAIPDRVYPVTNTPRNAIALVSRRISVLHMNEVATYLTVAILIWLIGTSLAVAVLQRRYTRFMMRNIDSIADVLVLVAGSENFLRLIQQRGLSLKRDREIRTKLGWFKGKDGEVRWGVEVVGGRDAVQWVDKPSDPNVSEKKPGLVRKTTQGFFSVIERVGTGGISRKTTARSP